MKTFTDQTDSTDHTPLGVLTLPSDYESVLAASRQRIEAGDAALRKAYDALIARADVALSEGPYSVVDDDAIPPSGDPRDYMSQGPYWWPNPDTDDGLPYVRRDGQTNPDYYGGDHSISLKMVAAVYPLTLAWYFTGNAAYAQHATRLLRTFFLDNTTRMNPHLNYGQGIPGICEGRGIGIIDTHHLIAIVEVAPLLASSDAWTDADMQGLRAWFQQYVNWLDESPLGKKERSEHNNHGTWFDAQFVAFSLFAQQPDRARAVLEEVGPQRIVKHIGPDGRQPHELARTLSFTYSAYNIQGLVTLASLGERVGVDLWQYEGEDGRCLRKAIEFVMPYYANVEAWPYPQIKPAVRYKLAAVLRVARHVYRDPAFEQALSTANDENWRSHPFVLLYPPLESTE
ncbi:alginate lyase family protein [Phycisphaerales bacterium AB-hyl4]|uniref:Alginate lyase family protein n=1 Tax=Natronomicrosphaera hydrolytica TaxID=3242702 RepID=A0ABV4U881_9BACT